MALLIPLFLFFLIYGYRIYSNVKNDREWHEGVFLKENRYEQNEPEYDPLLEAYISLGALMVRKDTSSYGEKILYLNNYFSKNFPNTHYDFGRSFTDSLKNPIRPKALSRYLNRKLPDRADRIQIMYFLAGLSTVDGSMNQREVELLKEVNAILMLSPKDFESVIAMYTQKQSRQQQARKSVPKVSVRELACKILGVSVHASKEEIKKAYRDLVKLHHPDRFATASKQQQELAEQRFIEIQKAYEALE